jgi:hypothetical protein
MRGFTVSEEEGPGAHAGYLQPAGHSPDPSDRSSHRASNKVMYNTAHAWLLSEWGGGAWCPIQAVYSWQDTHEFLLIDLPTYKLRS